MRLKSSTKVPSYKYKLYESTVPSNKTISDGTSLSNNMYFMKVLFDGKLKSS